jgi:prepilin-type N-terminal cleavage/methylation domain-containing protein/prepilin-type processing-associated H-X9-DG protein
MGSSARARNHIPNRPHPGRTGFTLTELVVCLAVIAILSGLTFPAVQKARAAAQRATCQNHLRQIGIASHAFEQAHGEIPLGTWTIPPPAVKPTSRPFSAQARLLPFLEADALAQTIDWTDDTVDFPGALPRANGNNSKLLTYRVSVFLCPADPSADNGANSYRQSVGWSLWLDGKSDPLPRHLTAIGDGTSNTAFFSDRLVGSEPTAQVHNPLLIAGTKPTDLGPACVQAQLNGQAPRPSDPYVGLTWFRGADRHVRYAHLFPPNSRLQDCEASGWIDVNVMTARSAHPGGINLLLADGHCRFIANDVDLAVWRAWGTPNGGEAVP